MTKIEARRLMEDKVLFLKTKSYKGMQVREYGRIGGEAGFNPLPTLPRASRF